MKKIPARNSSVPSRNSSVPRNLSLPQSPADKEPPSDLSKANAKLVAEIFIKNKIIHDLTVENAWKKSSESPLEKNYGKLFTVLKKINVDLEKAYSVCEQNSLNILSLEKQKLLVQEENLYLRSVLEQASIDPALFKLKNVLKTKEPARVEALEAQLRDAEGKNAELNKQMQYWINVSKKSQESKLIAEASSNVLAKELEKLKRSSKRTSQQIVIQKLEEQLKEKEETIMKHLTAQEKIETFSSSLEESYTAAEKLENENNDLKENLKLKETLIVDLKEQLSLLIEKEETVLANAAESDTSNELSKKYDKLAQERQDLVDGKKILSETLDKVNKKVADLENENQKLVECLKTESQKIMDYENLLKEVRSSSKKIDENEYNDMKEKLKVNENVITFLREKLEALEEESLAATSGTGTSDEVKNLEVIQNLNDCKKQLADALNESKVQAQELDSLKATVELQKKELASKESEVVEFHEKLELLTNQVAVLEKASFIADEKDKQVVELLNQCEQSYADYENKSAELDKLQEDAKSAQLELVELKNVLKGNEATLEAQKLEIADLKTGLESKEEAIQHLILQYENLEQSNSKLVLELDVYKKSKDSSILEEMKNLTDRNILLEEQLNEMLDEQNKVENASSELSELKLQEKLANQALDVVQTELLESKEEIKKLEAMLNDSKSNQELLQRKIEYYAEKLEKYEKQLETADEIVASSNSTQVEAQNFLQQFESSERRNKILEEELVRVVSQLEESQKKLDAVGEKADDSSGDSKRHALIQAELEEKIKQLAILEHEHKSLGTLFSILKTELDAKDSDSKSLRQTLDLAMKELEEEKNIVSDMKGEFKEIESLKNMTISDKKEIQELSRMLSFTSERNSHLEVVIKKLEKDFSELRTQEKSKDSDIDEQVAHLEKEIEAQLVALKRSEDEAKELKEKYLKEKRENESLADFIKQADVPALLIRVGFLEKQALEYESKTAELLAAKSALESKLSDSEALILKLQDENSAQEGSVFQAPQVLIEKQQMIDELSQLNENLFRKIETLSRKLEIADSARPNTMRPGESGLESFIIASQKQAEEAESAIEALTDEVAKAYERINALVVEKADLEDEIYNLRNR